MTAQGAVDGSIFCDYFKWNKEKKIGETAAYMTKQRDAPKMF